MAVTNGCSVIHMTNGLNEINRMSHLRQLLFMSAVNVVAIESQNFIKQMKEEKQAKA
jgi:hypothetical protein